MRSPREEYTEQELRELERLEDDEADRRIRLMKDLGEWDGLWGEPSFSPAPTASEITPFTDKEE